MKSFGFNLLPQKSKEVIIEEDKRDRTSVFTALLPLLGVTLWLLLVLFNGLVVDGVKANWEKAIIQKENRINTEFLPVRIQHGELVIKTRTLSELVLKDIKPETLFILTETIFPTEEADVEIIGYGRNDDGSFSLALRTGDHEKFAEITRRFSNYEGAETVTISSIFDNPQENYVQGLINFFIDEEFIENGSESTDNN